MCKGEASVEVQKRPANTHPNLCIIAHAGTLNEEQDKDADDITIDTKTR